MRGESFFSFLRLWAWITKMEPDLRGLVWRMMGIFRIVAKKRVKVWQISPWVVSELDVKRKEKTPPSLVLKKKKCSSKTGLGGLKTHFQAYINTKGHFLWQPEFEWTELGLCQWLMLKACKHNFHHRPPPPPATHYHKRTLLIWHFVLEGKCCYNIGK